MEGFTTMTDTAEDRVKARLQQVVVSCLEHLRVVRFGTGTAAYDTTDGDLRLTVMIQISSTAVSPKAP
jgi:hypothetical protein